MTDVNNPVAEASTAAPETREPVTYNGWDEHGTPIVSKPDQPQTGEPAASATPAKEVESEPKGKTAAETETAPKQERERKPGEKKGAEERISQLTAEIKELKARLDTKPVEKVEEKPEAKQAERLKRPNLLTWTGTPEEFDKAQDAYETQERKIAIAEFQQRQAVEAARKEMSAKLEDAKRRYPDAEARIVGAAKAIIDDPQVSPVIKALLDETDILPDLIYALGEPEKLGEFIQRARNQPGKAIRELVVMENLVREELNKPAKAETIEAPPAEPKPRAPKPPSEVGGRGAPHEDGLVAAARSGDFRAFEAEETRRKMARN